jgi:hypothetical protein
MYFTKLLQVREEEKKRRGKKKNRKGRKSAVRPLEIFFSVTNGYVLPSMA